MDALALTIAPASYDEAAVLVAELDADLAVRYPGGSLVVADAAQFTAARGGAFYLAVIDGGQVGCAGLRRETDTAAELKRMYVRPGARGLGVARALLATVEQGARDLGYTELWLETGLGQPEAIALYETSGYAPVARFGQFADAPDARHLGRAL